ncbi:MAG: hypothetical protein OXB86_02720 [Bdellovibrionales bacterium]|nr:hypothetical protein [Bdellovibrionales bacterium]
MKYLLALSLFLSGNIFYGAFSNADDFSNNNNIAQLKEKVQETGEESLLWLYAGLGIFFGSLFGVEALGGLEQFDSTMRGAAKGTLMAGLLSMGTGAVKLCHFAFLNRKLKKLQPPNHK